MTRLDRRGRRIGRNRWREWITDEWRSADHAWWLDAEAKTSLWPTEMAEHRAHTPRPNLGAFMTELSPAWWSGGAP